MKSLLYLFVFGISLAVEKTKTKKIGDTNRIQKFPSPDEEIEKEEEQFKFPTEVHESAFKVARYIRDVFFFIDKDADNNITQSELLEIYQKFGWPKYVSKNDKEMVQYLFHEYGEKDINMSFVNFCNLMENLWKIQAQIKQEACLKRIRGNLEAIQQVFNYLDPDGDKLIKELGITQGMTPFLGQPIPDENIEQSVEIYGKQSPQSLNEAEWFGSLIHNIHFKEMTIKYKPFDNSGAH